MASDPEGRHHAPPVDTWWRDWHARHLASPAKAPGFSTYAPAPVQRDAHLRQLEARIAALAARVDALEADGNGERG